MFVCLKQTMNSTADNKLCNKEDNVLPTSDCGATAKGFTVEQQKGFHCGATGRVSLWSNRKGFHCGATGRGFTVEQKEWFFHCGAIGRDFTVEQQQGVSLWNNRKGFSLWSNRKGFHCGTIGMGLSLWRNGKGFHCAAIGRGFTEQKEGGLLWRNRKGFHCGAEGSRFIVEQKERISLWSKGRGFTVKQTNRVTANWQPSVKQRRHVVLKDRRLCPRSSRGDYC